MSENELVRFTLLHSSKHFHFEKSLKPAPKYCKELQEISSIPALGRTHTCEIGKVSLPIFNSNRVVSITGMSHMYSRGQNFLPTLTLSTFSFMMSKIS